MAALCDMKQPMYARYESGVTIPSAELIFRLCVAFGCTSDYLLGLSDEPPTLRDSASSREIHTGAISGGVNVFGDGNTIAPPKSTSTSPSTSTHRKRKAKE